MRNYHTNHLPALRPATLLEAARTERADLLQQNQTLATRAGKAEAALRAVVRAVEIGSAPEQIKALVERELRYLQQ